MRDYTKIHTVYNSTGDTVGRVISQREQTYFDGTKICLGVRWPDGKLTWPCTAGMCWVGSETMQIGPTPQIMVDGVAYTTEPKEFRDGCSGCVAEADKTLCFSLPDCGTIRFKRIPPNQIRT